MPRLALKALEAYAQLERYLFIDGQPTSVLIRGGDLRGVHRVVRCLFTSAVRTNAYLYDRLVSADSCDPLHRALEITEQVDDYFGAVLNSKRALGRRRNSGRVVAGSVVNSLITPGHLCILVLMCLSGVPVV